MGEVEKRYATDDAFREVADLLFGGGMEIHKANPDGADIMTRKQREKRQAQVGLASNIVGLGAGAAGLYAAGGEYKKYRKVKTGDYYVQQPKKISGKTKAAAGAALGLQALNLGGDVVANRVLAREANKGGKKKPRAIKKNIKEIKENASFPKSKGELTLAAIPSAARAAGKGAEYSKKKVKSLPNKVETKNVSKARAPKIGSFRRMKQDATHAAANANWAAHKVGQAADEHRKTARTTRRALRAVGAAGVGGAAYGGANLGEKARNKFKKNDDLDVRWQGEISKIDSDKQQVFGWASIVEMNGEPVVDLQGDYITIDEVEKSAYDYVHKSRKGGDMHLRDNFGGPVAKSHMIESFVVTPEKKQSLGLPESTPTGWWVGYQVNDPELWAKVKSGERTGFSIHGRGVRE